MPTGVNYLLMETKYHMKIMNWHKARLLVTANLVLMSILFPGCLSTQETAIPSLTLTLPPVLATTTPLPTGNPSPSPTPPLTGTPVPLPGDVLDRCVEITQLPLPQLQGTLALQHIIRVSLKDVLFLKLDTHKEHFISKPGGEYYSNETVSPKGTYFAAETFSFSRKGEYPEYHQGPIVIFDSGGNLVAKVDLKQESYGFKWLNEEQILMNYPYEDGNPVILISPFKHTQKKIQPFITDIFYPSDTSFLEWGFYGTHKNVYDPQMTRALYPSSDENGRNVTLRDIEQGIDLASFYTRSTHGNSPTWSLDGEKLAVALNVAPFVSGGDLSYKYEIFVINRNGEKLLTTSFGDFSKTTHIMNLSWSPNGRYIAFWYTNDKNHLFTNLQLAIWDTETLTTSRYCINSGDDYLHYPPIWSPASDYLILAYKASGGEKASSSLLLDISDGKAWVIKPEFEPLGWLK